MGWYGQGFYPGSRTPKQIRDEEMTGETEERRWRVLRSAWINFREYYAAIEITDKTTGKATVYGGMDLLEVRREDGRMMLWHKPMGEDSGPGYHNCPKAILDLLTDPAPNEYAANWRARCREVLAEKKKATGLKLGDRVTFTYPFGNLRTWHVVGFEKGRGGRGRPQPRFGREPGGMGYKLIGWSTRVAAVEAV